MSRLKEDLLAYAKGSVAKMITTALLNSNFKAIRNYRIAHFLYKSLHLKFLPRLLHYRSRIKYAIDIDFRAEIEGGFRILHGMGLVIGLDVRAGKNFTCYQGVTLGGNSGKERTENGVTFSQPQLGDNVTLYANSAAFGPVILGDGCTIGAGAVILKDVEKNSIVYCKEEIVTKQSS